MKRLPYEPQLATLKSSPPEGDEWFHEIKFDGYRTLIVKNKKTVRIFTRNGHDWTDRYQKIADEALKIPAEAVVLDGEIVALNEKGIPDFNRLQNAMDTRQGGRGLVFYCFDILAKGKIDLRRRAQVLRKKELTLLFRKKFSQYFLLSEAIDAKPADLLRHACELGLEGIVSKKKDAPYSGGRNENWIKVKCVKSDEFVIIGYLTGEHHELGSLLLGLIKGKVLTFAGKVGTGFSAKKKTELVERLRPLVTKTPAVRKSLKYPNIVWVKPKLVAEINYLEQTPDGSIRHGSFQRLREDKEATQVTPESEEKVMFPKAGITREDLRSYYQKIQRLFFPYIADRPLNLFICHESIHGRCYHLRRSESSRMKGVRLTKKPNGHFLMTLEKAEGISDLIDLGTIEFHVWGTRLAHLEKPDMVVFDLDPGEGVSLAQVRGCTLALRELLKDLGLESFVKTSGGKGFHVHVPVAPAYTWRQVNSFAFTVVQKMEQDFPKLCTSEMSPAKRKNRIFIDYLRNHRGATAVAPYSVRARDKGTLAVPIAWRDLAKTTPDQFTLHDASKLLRRKDPWEKLPKLKQKIALFES